MLIESVSQSTDLTLAAALDVASSPMIGQDACAFLGKPSGVLITENLSALKGADCLIDFTRPEGSLQHLAACAQYGINMVIGTTGFDEAGKAAIAEAAKTIGVVFAPNMSVGVNATLKLLDMAARILNSGYDVEVFEAHHHHKVDAPSGTALKMGETIAQAWGHTGPRETGTIGFSVVRGGDIVGDHTVYFCGIGERIEISHRSSSRAGYAEGSLRAARFLKDKKAGLFDMQTVLGL